MLGEPVRNFLVLASLYRQHLHRILDNLSSRLREQHEISGASPSRAHQVGNEPSVLPQGVRVNYSERTTVQYTGAGFTMDRY